MKTINQFTLFTILSFSVLILITCKKDPGDPAVDFLEYETNQGEIGAGGGKIIVTDPESELFGVGVDVPQGALANTQQIVFSIAEEIVPPTDSLATVISMEPSGLTFAEPVRIYLPFDGNSEPTAYYYNSDSAYLELLEVVSYDEPNDIVKVETDHFSEFFAGEDGVYVDAELFYIDSKVRCQLQFGGYDRDIRMWTGGIDLRYAPFLFGGLQYWNALGFLETANPIGTYNNHCYVTIDVELRRLRTIGSELIEQETYAIQRIGTDKGQYSAIVYRQNNSGSFEQIYETKILTRVELDIYFSGKALTIDFDNNISPDEEYFIKTSWVLSDNINGTGVPMGHRWTDKYSLSTRLLDDGVWDISLMYRADQDQDNNSIVDEFEKEKGDPPVADFEASYTAISVDGTIEFTDLSTGNPTSWAWDFGDGGSSTQQNPSHKYTTVGTYSVTLTASNEHGSKSETKEDYIIIVSGGSAPIAGFEASYTAISVDGTIEFTDLSTGNPTSWAWDFGDGGSSTQQNPPHTYTTIGTYSVSLTATNEYGSDTETKEDYIIIVGDGAAPAADFEASYTSISEGSTIDFTDLSIYNPTSWSWDFGDGGSSTEQNPSHAYTTLGTYTVSLTATNEHGSDTEVKSDYIVVDKEGAAPVADFVADKTEIFINEFIWINDLSTNNPTSWRWEVIDGPVSNTQNTGFISNEPGFFSISLTATNDFGSDTQTKSDYITVKNPSFIQAELVVEEMHLNVINPTIIDEIEFRAVIRNVGEGFADYVCLMQILPEGETGFYYGPFSMATNETIEIGKAFNHSIAKDYRVSVIADATNQIQEEDELNNSQSIEYTVTETFGNIINGSLNDIRDNTEYITVKIGNQWWMAENLKYLPSVNEVADQSYTENMYYVYDYNGVSLNEAKENQNYMSYGVLYNYAAAVVACPDGWHLPSDAEWQELIDYLALNGYNWDGRLDGYRMAKSLANESGWQNSINIGTPGSDKIPSKSNATGFSALPGGYKANGEFYNSGTRGYWWSQTSKDEWSANIIGIAHSYEGFDPPWSSTKRWGNSVRCVKD